jgi:hypothetical protein
MPSVIVYVGDRHEEFAREFRQFGIVTPPLPKLSHQRPEEGLALIQHRVVDPAFLA